jgi:hypothetical protein
MSTLSNILPQPNFLSTNSQNQRMIPHRRVTFIV